jgi:Kef-type K+ transport system membrane component KefB
MHYLLKPLLRAMRHMNDRELKLSIILGFLLVVTGLAELLGFGLP